MRTPSGFGKRDTTTSPYSLGIHPSKAWDVPRVTAVYEGLLETATVPLTRAQLLAACRRESGVWLHALLMSPLGFRMDNAVIRMAMGLHLGVPLCCPHVCLLCGEGVDSLGTHGLHCSMSLGYHHHHSTVNDVIKRSLASAKIAAHLEPVGICRADGKRPDRATIMSWQSSCILIWDVTCPDTFAPSHGVPTKAIIKF